MSRPDPHLIVALLAGGRGTRFWPLSRRARPKQLLDLAGDGPMLSATRERVAALCPARNVLVVTTRDLAAEVGRMLRMPRGNVLAEPAGRNTAGAIGLAALVAHARDPEAVVLALPADHAVAHPARLRRALATGVRAARRLGGIVLFGEKPHAPEESYGYITLGAETAVRGIHRVARFREKPAAAAARRLVAAGALWNSGMFCFRAESVLDEMERTLPALAKGLEALRPHVGRASWTRFLSRIHPKLPAISFDHGVLERSRRVHVLPVSVGWSDVGTWESLARRLAADRAGNRARGRAVFHEAAGCLAVQAEGTRGRTIVVLGARDLMLVDAGDVVLACPRGKERELRELVARLERERPELA